ncbi:type II 3-dehydroquinate dehydratase [Limibacter armeniacum]|uniref:type II 3-dehydroquinate dehydratase n=1 Tax=Limibacter armeniacum TaxID=466084 RepID=UPI002FE5F5F2
MKILILNGPNLNLLGKREPEIYGKQSFEDYLIDIKAAFPSVEIRYEQSNSEGKLIDFIHEVGFAYDGIVLNAGAYTHTSVAIGDAIAGVNTPVVEVHISNVHAREEFRHKSFLAKNCIGVMAGFGLYGYQMAIDFLIKRK